MMKPGSRISRTTAATLLAATAVLILPACFTFGPVETRKFIVSSRPQQVWIYKADSSVVLMRGPHFLPGTDTLVGMVDGAYSEIALSDVQQTKASRAAPARTAGLVVGGIGAVVITAVLLKK